MHLGRPDGMSFDAVADGNPDWLNRLLIRKKEAEVGIAFNRDHAALVPNSAWNNRRPAIHRPARAAADRARGLDDRRGELHADAEPPARRDADADAVDPWSTPIRVLLGDFLGNAGVISRTAAGVQTTAFASSLLARRHLERTSR